MQDGQKVSPVMFFSEMRVVGIGGERKITESEIKNEYSINNRFLPFILQKIRNQENVFSLFIDDTLCFGEGGISSFFKKKYKTANTIPFVMDFQLQLLFFSVLLFLSFEKYSCVPNIS